MNLKYNMEDFLKMYYFDHNIPMYIYADHTFDTCVPQQTSLTFPPQKYVDILISKSDRISYCATTYGIYFGCLRLDFDITKYLIIGPVSNVPYSKETLHNMYRDYVVSNENREEFNFKQYDYVIDAIDTVTAKLDLIERARSAGVPVISSMGTGNKLDPTRFEVTVIEKTSVCPLAKVMRRELKKRGIRGLKVVYSQEEPLKQGERTPASISFVPPVAGMILAGEVIKDLIK